MEKLDIATITTSAEFADRYRQVVARLESDTNLAPVVLNEVDRAAEVNRQGLELGQLAVSRLPFTAQESHWVFAFEQFARRGVHKLGESLAATLDLMATGGYLSGWFGSVFDEAGRATPEVLHPAARLIETSQKCVIELTEIRNPGLVQTKSHWTATQDHAGTWSWYSFAQSDQRKVIGDLATKSLEALVEILSRPSEPVGILDQRFRAIIGRENLVAALKTEVTKTLEERRAKEAQVLADIGAAIRKGGLAAQIPHALVNAAAKAAL